jgi:hypothetical protein
MNNRIEFPVKTNFKTNEMLTDNIQIINSLIKPNGDIINFPVGVTGTLLLSSQLENGLTGPTGMNGATGVQGTTGFTSVTSPVNTKIIIAYIFFGGSITYQNGTAITSISWGSTGILTIKIQSGFFSATPQNVQLNVGASSIPPFNTSIL